jgi:hypothetical protein
MGFGSISNGGCMSEEDNSLFAFVEAAKQKAPAYLNLMTAKSDVEFELAFESLLEKAVSGLEQSKKVFEPLGEEGLSSVLALALNIPGCLTVTRETHSNGHVDLTIEAEHCTPARRKLGEAKIYDGPAYHFKGLEQLLGRYSTGREGRGLLIVYVRKQDIAGLMKKLREKMDIDLPCQQQGKTADHILKWSFLTTHAHSCGENLEVSHIGCNLYTESTAQSA